MSILTSETQGIKIECNITYGKIANVSDKRSFFIKINDFKSLMNIKVIIKREEREVIRQLVESEQYSEHLNNLIVFLLRLHGPSSFTREQDVR